MADDQPLLTVVATENFGHDFRRDFSPETGGVDDSSITFYLYHESTSESPVFVHELCVVPGLSYAPGGDSHPLYLDAAESPHAVSLNFVPNPNPIPKPSPALTLSPTQAI